MIISNSRHGDRLWRELNAKAFFELVEYLHYRYGVPDPPSRHHLLFDGPFDKLTVLRKVEGLTALRKSEGRRCLRSLLSFDLEALDRLAA